MESLKNCGRRRLRGKYERESQTCYGGQCRTNSRSDKLGLKWFHCRGTATGVREGERREEDKMTRRVQEPRTRIRIKAKPRCHHKAYLIRRICNTVHTCKDVQKLNHLSNPMDNLNFLVRRRKGLSIIRARVILLGGGGVPRLCITA